MTNIGDMLAYQFYKNKKKINFETRLVTMGAKIKGAGGGGGLTTSGKMGRIFILIRHNLSSTL